MPSGMEPEIRKHLQKVGYSFFAGLLWLLVNVTLGIYFRLAIADKGVSLVNILFYGWFLFSIALLLYYFYRTWRGAALH
ncbi:MAG: hypothetical protein GC171_11175 [Terrimonas sp.]|nr:hypothetical protein [Terrimonas sp.]